MASFKGIIKNMVEIKAKGYAEKKTGKFYEVEEGTFNLTNGSNGTEPMWNVVIKEMGGFRDYRMAGYVDDYGTVVLCSVIYTRTYCDPDGSNRRIKTKCLSGKEMEAFEFDN